jgi:hypothetical protein
MRNDKDICKALLEFFEINRIEPNIAYAHLLNLLMNLFLGNGIEPEKVEIQLKKFMKIYIKKYKERCK